MKDMSVMAASLLTSEEYIATGDTRLRWTELVNGEVIVNTPSIRHQETVTRIHEAIRAWIRSENGHGRSPGQLDVRLSDSTVVAPDVLWASEGRIPEDGTHLVGAPELVVEVRSPSTWTHDTTTKFRQYESAGVVEIWLVDTAANTVLVYRRSAPGQVTFDVSEELGVGQTLRTPLFNDFGLDIAALFALPGDSAKSL
jgi:Uma2 family endonuclease